MKTLTKEQVIKLVSTADGVLIATNAGEQVTNHCEELAENLKGMCYHGLIAEDKAPADITESPNYEPEWGVYKFSDSDCNTIDSDLYINIGEQGIEKIYYTSSKEVIEHLGLSNRSGVTIHYHAIDKYDSQYDKISSGETNLLFAHDLQRLKELCEQRTGGANVDLQPYKATEITGERQIVEDTYVTYVLIDKNKECIADKYIYNYEMHRPCYWAEVCAYDTWPIGIIRIARELSNATDEELCKYNKQARINLGR